MTCGGRVAGAVCSLPSEIGRRRQFAWWLRWSAVESADSVASVVRSRDWQRRRPTASGSKRRNLTHLSTASLARGACSLSMAYTHEMPISIARTACFFVGHRACRSVLAFLTGTCLLAVSGCAESDSDADGRLGQVAGDDSKKDDSMSGDDAGASSRDDSSNMTDDTPLQPVNDDGPTATDDGPAPGPAQPDPSTIPTSDTTSGPQPDDECPRLCAVPAICQLCDDGSCATPQIECNPDGSCGALDWMCSDGGGPDPVQCDQPNRRYVANSAEQCALVRFACEQGERMFSDECGCGCESTGSVCEGIDELLAEEWEIASYCDRDDECELRYNNLCGLETPALGAVGCYLPVGADADLELLKRLEGEVIACGLVAADCDCSEPPPAACVNGRCAPVDDATLCEDTGGTWMPSSCGHYDCGRQPACRALVPGCDCGPTQNFASGLGCLQDPECGLD